jgi:hypothetical protein
MTSHITKLFQITLTTLAIFPLALTLNLSPVRAEAPDTIGDITNITEKIARNPLTPATRQSPQGSTDTEVSAEREQSMEYVQQGIEAQKSGNEPLAIANYYTAIKTDITNGYGFLFAGQLIGETDPENGINCAKAAAALFADQQDREGYELAIYLLRSLHVNV